MRALFVALSLLLTREGLAVSAQALFESGKEALARGDSLQAANQWSELVKDYRNHPDAKTVMSEVMPRLAALWTQQSHFQEGLEIGALALQKFPQTPYRPELLRLQSVALLGLGKISLAESALALWQKECSPAPSEVLPLQGRLLLLQNRFTEAAALFKKVRDTGSSDSAPLEVQARLLARDLAGASNISLPDTAAGHLSQYQLAQALSQSGKPLEALRLWRPLRSKPPLKPAQEGLLDLQIARTFLELRRPREAALLLKDFATRFPNSPHPFAPLLAHALLASDQTEVALQVIRSSPKSDPALERLELETLFKIQDLDGIISLAKERLQQNHPDAHRYQFLLGQTLSQQGKNDEALAALRECLSKNNPYQAPAAFWIAMTHLFDRRYAEAEPAFLDYEKRFPNDARQPEARFRLAQISCCQKNYPQAILRLKRFLSSNTAHQSDANLLLGDSYFSIAQLDDGLRAYRQIPPDAGAVYDQAQFQIARALRQRSEWDALRNHFASFAQLRSESPRLAEILHQAARLEKESGRADRALELYDRILKKHGNDPKQRNFEEILVASAQFTQEPRAVLLKRWEEEAAIATQKREAIRALRWTWACAELLRKSDPAAARNLLLNLKPDLETTPPRLLAAWGNASFENGDLPQARRTYEALLRWNPRALEKADAFAGLGLVCAAEGSPRKSLDRFSQWESCKLPSPLESEIRKTQLHLFTAQRQWSSVVSTGDKLLKCRSAPSALRAETLAAIGDAYRELQQPERAIAYYQRLYVMYSACTDPVARAYWGSAQSFEALGKNEAARKTYQEMLAREDLKSHREYAQAATRLAALGIQ